MTKDFARILEDWYALNQRPDLPWRGTRNPYFIWVSEIILQQTRVEQGRDYYVRFISRFPDVESLAAADEDEVLNLWQGLGYYSRARNLHAAAKEIVKQGGFPDNYAGVRALKGVGDYTAAAICSMAYNLPHAVVDGNVYRVLSRFYGIDVPIDTTEGKKHFAALADSLLDCDAPGLYNQAIMDFGAVQCLPRAPRCSDCVLSESCQACAEGNVEQLPVKVHHTVVKNRFLVYVCVVSPDGSILMHKRGAGDIWQGLYEPLLLEFAHAANTAEVLAHPKLSSLCSDSEVRLEQVVHGKEHILTHRRLIVDAYLLQLTNIPDKIPDGYRWISTHNLSDIGLPRIVEIIFDKINQSL